MSILGLDHVNIRTTDVAASAQFYVELFGFVYHHGKTDMGFETNWLYDKSGNPIIHFRVMEPEAGGTGALDHVALRCVGKVEILQRLTERGITFNMFEGGAPGLTQIFLKDPHGIGLELKITGE